MLNSTQSPAVTGLPRIFLHLEGAALLALAVGLYHWGGYSWWIFFVFFFAPDIAFLAYLIGPRAGAVVYNCFHTTTVPASLIGLAVLYDYAPIATIGAAIWTAHIGYDRLGGWGLKYPTGYKDTMLGRLWWPPNDGGWHPRRPTQPSSYLPQEGISRDRP